MLQCYGMGQNLELLLDDLASRIRLALADGNVGKAKELGRLLASVTRSANRAARS